jgi:FkbM family methyltransferase
MHCFEPDARARERFLANVSDRKVRLYSTAVGAKDGVTSFYPSKGMPAPLPKAEAEALAARLPHEWDLSGSIHRPKNHLRFHPWCLFGSAIEVPIIKLDTWKRVCAINVIDFLWADVQGAEGDLIAGATETLNETRYFYTEYSNSEMYEGQVTLWQLQSLLPGFAVVKVFNEDVLLRNTRFA